PLQLHPVRWWFFALCRQAFYVLPLGLQSVKRKYMATPNRATGGDHHVATSTAIAAGQSRAFAGHLCLLRVRRHDSVSLPRTCPLVALSDRCHLELSRCTGHAPRASFAQFGLNPGVQGPFGIQPSLVRAG